MNFRNIKKLKQITLLLVFISTVLYIYYYSEIPKPSSSLIDSYEVSVIKYYLSLKVHKFIKNPTQTNMLNKLMLKYLKPN